MSSFPKRCENVWTKFALMEEKLEVDTPVLKLRVPPSYYFIAEPSELPICAPGLMLADPLDSLPGPKFIENEEGYVSLGTPEKL